MKGIYWVRQRGGKGTVRPVMTATRILNQSDLARRWRWSVPQIAKLNSDGKLPAADYETPSGTPFWSEETIERHEREYSRFADRRECAEREEREHGGM